MVIADNTGEIVESSIRPYQVEVVTRLTRKPSGDSRAHYEKRTANTPSLSDCLRLPGHVNLSESDFYIISKKSPLGTDYFSRDYSRII